MYIVLSRYALPRVSDVIEERKDIIAHDIDSAKEYSEESEKAIEELNLKLSEAKTSSQNLINKSIQDIKEDSEIKKSSLIKKINNEISEAEGEIKEKKETALAEISSISESLAIEMLESLSVGEIDKGKIAALSKTDN